MRAQSIQKSIASMVCGFPTIMTENGTLALLWRSDRDVRLQCGDVLVTLRGARMPLLLRPTKEDGEYENLGFCHYKGFEYSEGLFSDQVLKPFVLV
jgi:hypothetical protein